MPFLPELTLNVRAAANRFRLRFHVLMFQEHHGAIWAAAVGGAGNLLQTGGPTSLQVRLARPVSRRRDLAEKAQQCASSPLEFKLKVRFHGSWEEFSLQAHDLRAHFSELGGKTRLVNFLIPHNRAHGRGVQCN